MSAELPPYPVAQADGDSTPGPVVFIAEDRTPTDENGRLTSCPRCFCFPCGCDDDSWCYE